MWKTGNDNAFQAKAADGLRDLVIAIDDVLAKATEATTDSAVSSDEARRLLLELIPPSLAFTLQDTSDNSSAPVDVSLFTPFLTDIQRKSLPLVRRLWADQRNSHAMMVVGPPGCGKTVVGRIAAASCVMRGQSALVLLPTKATVREGLLTWQDWAQNLEDPYRIVAGSADDRQYDDALSAGRFDVAVCVYEKALSLLARDTSVLQRIGLVVVDEFQNISSHQRGPKLEALLTLIRIRHPHIRLVCLSATMSEATSEAARRWLGITQAQFCVTTQRPVELTVHVLGKQTHLWRTEPSQIDAAADDRPTREFVDESDKSVVQRMVALRKRIAEIDMVQGERRSRLTRLGGAGLDVAILLTCALLLEDDESDRRIICFVDSRKRARRVVRELREVLEICRPLATPGDLDDSDAPRNPWLHGRYASNMSHEAATELYDTIDATDDHEWRNDVLDGFATGIAYHTRTLEAVLRRHVEDEFKGGLVRVIVSTDTLAEGINLPASDVINVDMTSYERSSADDSGSATKGGGFRKGVIEVGRLKNRLGRAGRLGLNERGHAWTISAATGNLAPDDREAVANPDALWERWIDPPQLGQPLASVMTDDNVCELVLSDLAASAQSHTRAELRRRVASVTAATFLAQSSDRQPEVEQVLARLEEEGAVGARLATIDEDQVIDALVGAEVVGAPPGSPQRLEVTRLGLSIARRALPLDTSRSIQRIGMAAASGTGPLSLLYLAAQDARVAQSAGGYVSWTPPREHERRDSWGLVSGQVHVWSKAYGHPELAIRRQLIGRFGAVFVDRSQRKPSREIVPVPETVWLSQPAGLPTSDAFTAFTLRKAVFEDPTEVEEPRKRGLPVSM